MNIEKKQKIAKKINPKNDLIGSAITLSIVYIFRIIIIAFWIIAPIIFALIIAFDDGIRNLINYINSLIFYKPGEIYDVGINNLVIWIIAPFFWVFNVLIMLFFVVIPFFKKSSWRKKAYLSFNFIFWSLLFIAIIYAIWLTIPFYKHEAEVGSGESIENNNVIDFYWSSLNLTFNPFSGWMIALQSIYVVLFIFGIFLIFESDMLRKLKLDYYRFTVNRKNNSLMNQVLEGKINFGDYEAKDLNSEIKRLKNELTIEAREQRVQKRLNELEERANRKNAKKFKNKKETKL
ncbi:hypothetical protein [Spiroplasma taiwanense]|uniref:Transmembrane protein n=1 Tax=Spiroplasma taiwanense CT-1 TaxID=1276220 RepID=S5LW96_9MOLU|nr:hypothetical protein [Spiroplasma taiwanense]AGR40881.1 hypothetical protein STAIW_v1c02040 [Spiroplasma taiwanense CT-1]